MEQPVPPSANRRLRFIFMGIALVSTTCSTFFLKLQDNQTSDNMAYIHPFVQCILMYTGQLLCLFSDMIVQRISPSAPEVDKDGKIKDKAPSYYFALPALFDGIGSICYTFGIVFCALSISQIMGGMLIVSSAIFSLIILKKKLYRHHILSIVLVFLGILVCGFATLFFSKDDDSKGNSTSIVGILLMLVGNILWAFQYIVEEKLFGKYDVSPLCAIGTEGLAGVIYFTVLLLIFQFVKCTPKYVGTSTTDGICIYGVVEDSARALSQMAHNGIILGTSIGYIFIIAFVNYSLIAVVKYGSAIHSCIVSNLRTLMLWAISSIFLKERFNWLEFVGFVVFILLGSLIYNEVIVVPFLGFNKNLEKNKNENKEPTAQLIDNTPQTL